MRPLLLLLLALLALPACAAANLERLTLPPGFHIALYSDQVPSARAMALGAHGTVFVGSAGAGKVYALTDSNGDGVTDKVHIAMRGSALATDSPPRHVSARSEPTTVTREPIRSSSWPRS